MRMRSPSLMLWALGILPAFLSAGCGKQPAPPALSTSSAAAHWQIRLTTVPAAPRQLDPVQFRIAVTDKSGRAVSGAAVTVSLIMPSMDMGQNQSAAAPGAAGTYTATGWFTMPGDWQVMVQASKSAEQQSQSFPVTVQ